MKIAIRHDFGPSSKWHNFQHFARPKRRITVGPAVINDEIRAPIMYTEKSSILAQNREKPIRK
jgi:hypothetical protein